MAGRCGLGGRDPRRGVADVAGGKATRRRSLPRHGQPAGRCLASLRGALPPGDDGPGAWHRLRGRLGGSRPRPARHGRLASGKPGRRAPRGHPARSRGRANRPGGRLVLRCPSSEPRAGRGRCRRALVPGCGATARIQPAGPATSRPSGSGHRHRRFADVDGGRCRLAVGTYRGCHSAQPSVVNRPSKGFNDTHLSPRILPVW